MGSKHRLVDLPIRKLLKLVRLIIQSCVFLLNGTSIVKLMAEKDRKRVARWYFGGLGSAGAACCTHPLDLLKVHLQTQQEGKIGIVQQTIGIVKSQGALALYSGLSASLVRQLTYSTTRFAIYELARQKVAPNGETVPFIQ